VLLFALSSNAPDLSQTVDQLGHLAAQSVGCLSAPEHPDVVSCSVALLDARKTTPFRSDIPGRVPAQVGRWHSPKRMQEKTTSADESMPLDFGVDWEEVWSKGVSAPPLPRELQKLQFSEANSIIYFSDDAPEGLVNSLRQLPRSDKMGMICSSTPFVTGRPFTMFFNNEVYSEGAVGVAISGASHSFHADFPTNLRSITPEVSITSCEGNLINSLDNSNPTRLLLEAIKAAHIHKAKEDFYLALVQDGHKKQVFRVTSGDPSRGTISLESHAAPPKGSAVQLCYLEPPAPLDVLPMRRPGIQFFSRPQLSVGRSDQIEIAEGVEDGFVAGSENGFLVDEGSPVGSGWKCTLAGARCSLSW